MTKVLKTPIFILSLAVAGVLVLHPLPTDAFASPLLLADIDGESIDPGVVLPEPDIPLIRTITQPVAVPPSLMQLLERQRIAIDESVAPVPASAAQQPGACITPDLTAFSNLPIFISANTTVELCPGTYTLPANYPLVWFAAFIGNNATLDCGGASIIGNYTLPYDSRQPWEYTGIYGEGFDNITVRNCTLGGFGYGMFVGGGYDTVNHVPKAPKQVHLYNNSFTTPSYIDVVVSSATNSDIHDNTRPAGTSSIAMFPTFQLEFVSNSQIYHNTLLANGGVGLAFNANYNQVYDNTFGEIFNGGGFSEAGVIIDHGSAYNTVYHNTVNQTDTQIGIAFLASLMNDRDTDTFIGTGGAKFNEIYQNSGTNVETVVYVGGDTHDNVMHDNTFTGINGTAFDFNWGTNWGEPHHNRVERNNLTFHNTLGHQLACYFLSGTHDNVLVDNKFSGAIASCYDMTDANFYDENGKGNYWSGYRGPAFGCYDIDRNGICDAPYQVGNNSFDHFPISGVPILEPIANQTIDEGQTLELTVSATDPNGSAIMLDVQYPGGTFGASFADNGNGTGTLTWKPWFNQAGTGYEVVFSVTDGEFSTEESVLIDVHNYVVPPPTISLNVSTQSAVAGQPFTVTVSGSSEEALAAVWWGIRKPGNSGYDYIPGSVDGRQVNLAPAQDFGTCTGQTSCSYTKTVIIDEPGNYEVWANSRDTIYFSVVGEPHQASEGVGIPVVEINVAPTFAATPGTLIVVPGFPVSFNVTAHDANGDPMSITMVRSVPGATFTANDTVANPDGTSTVSGRFTWTPSLKQTGSYSVQFQVVDEKGAATVSSPVQLLVRTSRVKLVE